MRATFFILLFLLKGTLNIGCADCWLRWLQSYEKSPALLAQPANFSNFAGYEPKAVYYYSVAVCLDFTAATGQWTVVEPGLHCRMG
jgi:hypothetical protein